MITLYATPTSSYCAKTRILLRHKGLAYRELPPVGGYGSAEFRKVVPSGNLPAVVDDGLLIADSEAIAEYLEERYPDPPALPSDPGARAKVRERSRFNDTRLDPELRALYPHVRPSRRDPAKLPAIAAGLKTRLGQLGQMLRDTPDAGETLTLGDCGLPVTLFWIAAVSQALDLYVNWPPEVEAYRLRVGLLPPVRDEFERGAAVWQHWVERALRDEI